MSALSNRQVLDWYSQQPEPAKAEMKAKAKANAAATGASYTECIKTVMRAAELKSRLKSCEGKYKLRCDESQFSLYEVVTPTKPSEKNPHCEPREVPFKYYGSLPHAIEGVQRHLEREMLMPIPELDTTVIIAAIKQSQKETLKIVKGMLECQSKK